MNVSADSDLSMRSQSYHTAHEHFQEDIARTTDFSVPEINAYGHNLSPGTKVAEVKVGTHYAA